MLGPASSYSAFVIHMDWKVDNEARMEPPIHTEYLRSGGAMILIFMVLGAKAVISFCMRSAMPGYMVVPVTNSEKIKHYTAENKSVLRILRHITLLNVSLNVTVFLNLFL